MNAKNTYDENFTIRAYEIDPKGKASIQTICNYLQEIAGNHARKLGVSVEILLKKNLTWVLSRLHVQIIKYPFWLETIKIKTWPSGVEGLFAIRDFLIFNQKDEIIGKATTSWMLMDIVRKKPIPMPDFVTNIRIPQTTRAIDDNFEKLPRLSKKNMERYFNVRLSDLDINQHVNNVSYIEWAVETIPMEILNKQSLCELEVSFRAESHYGNKVVSFSQQIAENNTNIFLHRLFRESDSKELAVAKTCWRPL